MATIFTRIIQGEIPCYKIAEDDRFFAFLDINPLSKGHTLVVPKQETDYIFNLEDDTIGPMMVFAKKWPRPLKKPSPANASRWPSSAWKCPTPISIWSPSPKKGIWISKQSMSSSQRKNFWTFKRESHQLSDVILFHNTLL